MKKHYPYPSSEPSENLKHLIGNKTQIIKEFGENFYNEIKKDTWENFVIKKKLLKGKVQYKRKSQPDDFTNKKILKDLIKDKEILISAWGTQKYNQLKEEIWRAVQKEINHD